MIDCTPTEEGRVALSGRVISWACDHGICMGTWVTAQAGSPVPCSVEERVHIVLQTSNRAVSDITSVVPCTMVCKSS